MNKISQNKITFTLILFAFLYKINPVKNFSKVISYKLPERLENIYGYWFYVGLRIELSVQ